MVTPTAVGTGESGMINLVKSPFDKITVLLLVLSLVDQYNFPR